MAFPPDRFDDERKVADREMTNPADLPFAASWPGSAAVQQSVYVVKPDALPKDETQVRAEYGTSSPVGRVPGHRGVTSAPVRRHVQAASITHLPANVRATCTSELFHVSRSTIARACSMAPRTDKRQVGCAVR